MESLHIISDPSAMTAAWLTNVLRHAGIDGEVRDFDMRSIGTGQVGENIRFRLKGDGVPPTLVGKFSSPDPVSRKTAIAQKTYLREVFFYRNIQGSVDIATPTVYFADVDPETHNFVILMEDLAPGTQGDQIKGCSADEAALALEQLAKLQGPRWGDPKLLEYPLLSGITQKTEQMQLLYKSLEVGFVERYGERLGQDFLPFVSRVGDFLGRYNDRYQGRPGLIHKDYRVDNMMFGGPRPLTVVDWQSLQLGCPVLDVSYFLGTCLDPQVRRQQERHLLRHYLEVLASYKIDLSEDECFALYRNYAPAGLVTSVFGSMMVVETERGNDMFMAMATRSCQLCVDLEIPD